MQLAQINIAKMKAPLDSPVMKDFVDNLERINTLAEKSEGFIWRLKDDDGNATEIKAYDDSFILVNMSVWESIESLFAYVYKSDHAEIFARRKEWFDQMDEMHMALWYVEDNYRPTVVDGQERLAHLRKQGDTPYAFSFRKKYTIDDLNSYLSKN